MWVLIISGSTILFVVLLLCVPVHAVFSWNSQLQPKVNVTLVWLFGLVHISPRGKKAKKPVVEGKQKPVKVRQIRRIVRIVTTKGLIGRVGTFIGKLWRQIKIKELKGNFKLEVDDPAEAGFICGALGAVSPLFRSYPWNQFSVEPVLDEGFAVRGTARAVVSVLPIALVVPLLRLIFSKPVLQAARIAIFNKA